MESCVRLSWTVVLDDVSGGFWSYLRWSLDGWSERLIVVAEQDGEERRWICLEVNDRDKKIEHE